MFDTSKFKDTSDCFELEKQIELIQNEINYHYFKLDKNTAQQGENFLYKKKALMAALNCSDVIENEMLKKTTNILDKYKEETKTEVTEAGEKTRNVYLFIGASTLILGAIIIVVNSKKI